jgi:CRISPR/Cas system endoribonuclease Cas6 (RAMP superfamily)
LLDRAAAAADEADGVRLHFRSTTCRERYEGVWEVHPDRIRLFRHLAERWNAVADEDGLELAPTRDALGSSLYTVADTSEYDTNSIVVHRREPGNETDDADARSIAADGGHLNEVQGFQGEWEFRFKDASDATRTTVLALAQFAEYSGAGRHNARGAGSVTANIIGHDP